jgi:hypothetical protein
MKRIEKGGRSRNPRRLKAEFAETERIESTEIPVDNPLILLRINASASLSAGPTHAQRYLGGTAYQAWFEGREFEDDIQ